ncbi:Hypothetical predicted protein [Paramuricea clavata]|uniref:Uncharacterized protein n=1 Tax=Paramuricea clavata TaxID=317549 RepID=A0A7D9H8G0_PARCT|nr:Hypothetical predicted protein [Paramuricea clavata]
MSNAKLYAKLRIYFKVVISFIRFLSLILYAIDNKKCVIRKITSFADCHQTGTLSPDPTSWAVVWFVLLVVSAGFVSLIVYKHKGKNLLDFKITKAKKVWKKGSFISLLILSAVATGCNGYQVSLAPPGVRQAHLILRCFWPGVMVFVIFWFNYTPRVKWPPKECDCDIRYDCGCSAKKKLFFFYWISLLGYFFEVAVIWFLVALQVAHQLAPLIEEKFPDASLLVKAIIVLTLGLVVSFISRMLFFFWQKLFHGDRDLFSEPCSKLKNDTDEPTPASEQTSPASNQASEQTLPASNQASEQTSPSSNPASEQTSLASTPASEQTSPASNPASEQTSRASNPENAGGQSKNTSGIIVTTCALTIEKDETKPLIGKKAKYYVSV